MCNATPKTFMQRPHPTIVYSCDFAIYFYRSLQVEKGTSLEKAEQNAEEEAQIREKKAEVKARKLEREKQERYERLSAWKVRHNPMLIN